MTHASKNIVARSQAVNQGDSLISDNQVRFIDIVGDGPIEGLVNGAHSIFFDKAPLTEDPDILPDAENRSFVPDEKSNFAGYIIQERRGELDQRPPTGFDEVESFISVGQELLFDNPISRTIADDTVDEVRITIGVFALFDTDRETGNLNRASVNHKVEIAADGGAFQTTTLTPEIGGISNSEFSKDYVIELPEGNAPFTVRVTRTTVDSTSRFLNNRSSWIGYTEIRQAKLEYRQSALYATIINGNQFDQDKVPARSYEIKGKLVQIPSNYDPLTRIYSGIWDGTFQMAWCDNPVWVLYDLLTNERVGLGLYVKPDMIDKFDFYAASQWCDDDVPDGRGGMEPRYTFNAVLQARTNPSDLVRQIAATFGGMIYWGAGQYMLAVDRPGPSVAQFTPANVIGGEFNREEASVSVTHNRYKCTWNNPVNAYQRAVVVVEDRSSLIRNGPIERDVYLLGCTKESEAQRRGRYLMESERTQRFLTTFQVGLQHVGVRPGDLVDIYNPQVYRDRAFYGKVVSATVSELTLDRSITLPVGTHSITVTLPDLTVEQRDVTVTAGDYSVLALDTDLSAVPLANADFSLRLSTLTGVQHRVVSITETEEGLYEISALEYDPNKQSVVDEGVFLDDPAEPLFSTGPLDAPTNLTITEQTVDSGDSVRIKLVISFTPSQDVRVYAHQLSVIGPSRALERLALDADNNAEYFPGGPGFYAFQLEAIGRDGRRAVVVQQYEFIPQFIVATPPDVTGLTLVDAPNATEFSGRDAKFRWNRVLVSATDPLEGPQGAGTATNDPLLAGYDVQIYDDVHTLPRHTATVTDNQFVYTLERNIEDGLRLNPTSGGPVRSFTIEVKARRTNGLQSARPASLEVTNPPPTLPGGVSISASFKYIFVDYQPPVDHDYAGMIVWRSTTPGFTPTDGDIVFTGADNIITIDSDPRTTYYLRFAGFDVFGQTGLNISSEFTQATSGITNADLDPNSVTQDKFIQSLSDEINLIGVHGSNISTLQTTTSGLSSQITTVSNVANNANSAAQIAQNAVNDINGDLAAEIVLKTQVVSGVSNPVIAAIGLRSDQNGAAVNILADEFNIVRPVVGTSGTSQAEALFSIATVGGVNKFALNGTAWIADASIGNAQIGNLSADKITTGFLNATHIQTNSINIGEKGIAGTTTTGSIAPFAVTSNLFDDQSTPFNLTASWANITGLSVQVVVPGGESYLCAVTANVEGSFDADTDSGIIEFKVVNEAQTVSSVFTLMEQVGEQNIQFPPELGGGTYFVPKTVVPGTSLAQVDITLTTTRTFQVQARMASGSGGNIEMSTLKIVVFKR